MLKMVVHTITILLQRVQAYLLPPVPIFIKFVAFITMFLFCVGNNRCHTLQHIYIYDITSHERCVPYCALRI